MKWAACILIAGLMYLFRSPACRLVQRRTFFSALGSVLQPPPQAYHERKILPWTQKELFAVVSDVASYPHFVPFCTGSRIKSSNKKTDEKPYSMEAELTVGFRAFTESYTSKVTCVPYESVEAVAANETPLFTSLSTTWRFQPTNPPSSSTVVSLDLKYAFANPLHAAVSSTFFSQISKQMVEAFEKRCVDVYGSRP